METASILLLENAVIISRSFFHRHYIAVRAFADIGTYVIIREPDYRSDVWLWYNQVYIVWRFLACRMPHPDSYSTTVGDVAECFIPYPEGFIRLPLVEEIICLTRNKDVIICVEVVTQNGVRTANAHRVGISDDVLCPFERRYIEWHCICYRGSLRSGCQMQFMALAGLIAHHQTCQQVCMNY